MIKDIFYNIVSIVISCAIFYGIVSLITNIKI